MPRTRQKLWSLLGDLPRNRDAVRSRVVSRKTHASFVVEELLLDAGHEEKIPALFVRPRNATAPCPAILFNHSHGGRYTVGKRELLDGAPYLQPTSYAQDLAERGFAVLAIDHWNFGARHTRTESSLFKEMLWNGQVLWGRMLWDSVRALDYLATRPDVDARRIGTLGMSMGATMAWWLAALDTRVKTVVDIGCMTDFRALIDANGLDEHGVYYYVPALLNHFDAAGINALIAPRPHLSLNGTTDPLTPNAGLNTIDRVMKKIYRAKGRPDRWTLIRERHGHLETKTFRQAALKWLDHWLK